MTTEKIETVLRSAIRPSKLQPRTHFSDEEINGLALNMRNVGVMIALLVRPCAPTPEYPTARFELVDGERRWRAAGERPHPEDPELRLAPVEELPVVVRSLTDHVVLELMLSSAIQRQDLTPLEEAAALEQLLAQTDAAGAPIYTVATLAEKIGMNRQAVHHRLRLRKLTPLGREALAAGRISFSTARVICGAPASVIPLIEDQVLNPRKYDQWRDSVEPLNCEETTEMIAESYVRPLRGAPFAPEDGQLLAVVAGPDGERERGGACTDCPWNSRNQAAEGEDRPRRAGRPAEAAWLCLHPDCYQSKKERHVALELVKAKDAGATVLSDKESARAIGNGGHLLPNTNFVKLDEKVDPADLAKGGADKKVPTWLKVVEGAVKVPIVVAVDETGHVHRLVDRKLAVAAAEANGGAVLLSTGRGRSAMKEDYDEKAKRQAENAKERAAIGKAIVAELVARVEDWGVRPEVFGALLAVARRHAGSAGLLYVAKRRGIEIKPDQYTAIETAGTELTGSAKWALAVELLIAEDFAMVGSQHSTEQVPAAVLPLLEHFDVDVVAIEERVRAELAEKKKKKSAPVAEAPAEPVAEEPAAPTESIESIEPEAPAPEPAPKKKGGSDIPALRRVIALQMKRRKLTLAQLNEVAQQACGSAYEFLHDPSELRALIAALGQIPEPPKTPKAPKVVAADADAAEPKPAPSPALVEWCARLHAENPKLTIHGVMDALEIPLDEASAIYDAMIDAKYAAAPKPEETAAPATKRRSRKAVAA